MVAELSFQQYAVALYGAEPAPAERLRLLDPQQLSREELDEFDDLAADTETPSAFAQPWFLLPALTHCDHDQKSQLAVVENRSGRWLGAFAMVRASHHGRTPMPNWCAWRHPNQFVTAPLVRRGKAKTFWRALLDGLAANSGREVALCLSDLPLDDETGRALLELCKQGERAIIFDRRIERPLLETGPVPELPPRERRRLTSLARKLAREIGEPQFRLISDPREIVQRTASFLELECAGWKGSGGSALSCSPDTRALFSDVLAGGSRLGRAEVATLEAGGRLLAFSTVLTGQGRKFGFKMAYDESAGAYAPGLLLLDWLTLHHCQTALAGAIDSCCSPGQQPVSRLWHDRCALVDCRIPLGGQFRRGVMRAMVAGEGAYSSLKRFGLVSAPSTKS